MRLEYSMLITDKKNGVTLSIDNRDNNQGLSIRALLRNPETDTDITVESVLYLNEKQLAELNSVNSMACIKTEFFDLSLNMGDRIYNSPECSFLQSARLRLITEGSEANIHFVATKEDVCRLYNSFLQLIMNNESKVTHIMNNGEKKGVKISFSNQRFWEDGYGLMDITVSSDSYRIKRSVETDTEDLKRLYSNISDYIERKTSSLEIAYDYFDLNITHSANDFSCLEGEICDFAWPECNKIEFTGTVMPIKLNF